MGDCQNYGPFLGPYYNTGPNLGDPKRNHNFDKYYYDFAIVVATISTVSFGMTLTMTILALRVYIILSKHRSAATYAGCANPESPGIKP